AETAPRAKKKTSSARASESTATAVARDASAASRRTVEVDAVASTNKIEPAKETTVDSAEESAPSMTMVTPIGPVTVTSAPLRESQQPNIRAAWITAGFIGLAVLFLLVDGVIVKRTQFKERARVTPTVAQPTTQP